MSTELGDAEDRETPTFGILKRINKQEDNSALPEGVSSAPEEFQKRLLDALESLEGIICVADDILVYGEGDTEEDALKDHDRHFVALMECCAPKNTKLNAEKFKFKLREVKFMGNVITDKGMRPDPDKVSAITQIVNHTDSH